MCGRMALEFKTRIDLMPTDEVRRDKTYIEESPCARAHRQLEYNDVLVN
jgi:hypothetical protein